MSTATVNNIDYNKIYSSNNFGDFRFIEELEPRVNYSPSGLKNVERVAMIEFIYTGTQIPALVRDAIRGSIKDPYYPLICGVACVGNTYTNGDHRLLYDKWKAMINRVYNTSNPKNNAYKNCTVCPEWLCFETFIKSVPSVPGYQDMINNPHIKYSIDKDTLQRGVVNKIYSPSTCIFIPMSENIKVKIEDMDKSKTSSKYYGIVLDRDKYKVQSTVRTPYGPVGMYTNEDAAVNVREWYRQVYSPNATSNTDYPKMDLSEAINYRSHKKKPIQMYNLINNE